MPGFSILLPGTGGKNALWITGEMFQGSKEIVLVKGLAPVKPHHSIYTKEMAASFHLGFPGKQNQRILADKAFIKKTGLL